MDLDSSILKNMRFRPFLLLALLFSFSTHVFAQDEMNYEDNYDPFADYSEFVEATSEETDINFFKHGRMLSLAGALGMHTYTGEIGEYATRDPMFGLSFSYFFSLRFALQTSFFTTTHHLEIPDAGSSYVARSRLNTFAFHAKYFLNTQNMTRAFGELNPYIIGGFSQIMRETSTSYSILRGRDGALGFDAGFGIEYMFNRRKNYLGLMFLYQYADFPNEEQEIPSSIAGNSTGIKLGGDIMWLVLSVGVNF